MNLHLNRYFSGLVLILLLSACTPASQAPVPTGTPTPAGGLTPYLTRTPTRAVTPGKKSASPTPLPSPSPTPRTHTIKQGETVSGIALLYGVPIDAILSANPKLNPNLMVVGSTLVVPASQGTQSPGSQPATPTPLPVQLGGAHCLPARDGGAWCFVLARNPHKVGVESISVVFRIADENGEGMQSQTAFGSLDLLPAKGSLPLEVYFPAPVPDHLQVSAELQTALPVNSKDDRYLSAALSEVKTSLLPDGLSASVSGKISLEKGSPKAQRVWVLLTAYDAAGQVTGLRRWEMDSEQTLKAGKQLSFSAVVYSAGGIIARVELIVEARP